MDPALESDRRSDAGVIERAMVTSGIGRSSAVERGDGTKSRALGVDADVVAWPRPTACNVEPSAGCVACSPISARGRPTVRGRPAVSSRTTAATPTHRGAAATLEWAAVARLAEAGGADAGARAHVAIRQGPQPVRTAHRVVQAVAHRCGDCKPISSLPVPAYRRPGVDRDDSASSRWRREGDGTTHSGIFVTPTRCRRHRFSRAELTESHASQAFELYYGRPITTSPRRTDWASGDGVYDAIRGAAHARRSRRGVRRQGRVTMPSPWARSMASPADGLAYRPLQMC